MAVDLSAGQLDAAIRMLASQTGASIGFRDPALTELRVRPLKGRMMAGEALELLLRGTGAQARRVARGTYLIERAASPSRRTGAPRPRPAPPPPPEPALPPPVQIPHEIIVTASKRDTPLNAYPGGVQIIHGDQLSIADSTRGTGAIESRIASVVSTHLGPGRNKLFVRGIADSSFVGPTQATVGQYWGNSRITYSAPDPNLRLFDVSAVEVLEGPQGTLYGAGSLGGVVRVVPHSPELNRTSGSAWGGAAAVWDGQPAVDGGAIVNLPVVEGKLAFRALAFGSVEGGYIDDIGRGVNDINSVTTAGGRAALRFQPNDDFTIDLSVVGQRIKGDDSQYAEREAGDLARNGTMAQPYRSDYWLTDLVVRRQFGDIEWLSSLGYARQNVFETFEGVALADAAMPALPPERNAPATAYSQTVDIAMLTFESRLARRGPDGTGWLIAASLLKNEADSRRSMGSSALTGVTNKIEEATLYGEATLEPIRRVNLTLGGRLTHASLSGQSADVLEALAFRNDPEARAQRNETLFLPSAALAYRATDRLTLFARYQQGFRPGGIAVRQDYIQRFKGDRVTTSEAGGRFTSDSFDLAVTGSWTRWRNIQADLIDGFGFPTTANIGDGEVLSAGLSGHWRPVRGLELDAAVYLNDSKVTRTDVSIMAYYQDIRQVEGGSVLPTTAVAIRDDRLPNVADATARVGFRYDMFLTQDYDLTLAGHARYVGQSTLGIGPVLEKLQGDYLDTGLDLRVGNDRRGLSLSLTNLLNSRGNRFALGSPFMLYDREQITPLRPRSVRIGFDMAF
ncbi:TonB-dependent receptor domain-containing protein [Croceibacterium xixiisoli]|uniref:TonB-dependent receptor domain-containing protein n=1 Tax=Croceibacterium xixiisoli TaxID=1476466 RepID=UPI00361FB944